MQPTKSSRSSEKATISDEMGSQVCNCLVHRTTMLTILAGLFSARSGASEQHFIFSYLSATGLFFTGLIVNLLSGCIATHLFNCNLVENQGDPGSAPSTYQNQKREKKSIEATNSPKKNQAASTLGLREMYDV